MFIVSKAVANSSYSSENFGIVEANISKRAARGKRANLFIQEELH